MLSKATDLEIIVTDSEVEALILEANLIKKLKPRYNVSLKDDKSYPYIVITQRAISARLCYPPDPSRRVPILRPVHRREKRPFGA